ncbi:MAG: MJ0042-type zinc finger domain-containing protein, partial [Candidatus Deferrimicrobiaceae bacterium]
MAMVVQCNCCMTEYRLNEALLKGAKGACIRCPKCRERIFVENPGAARVAPPIPHRVPPPTAPPIGHMVPPPIAPPVPP